jgi:hypothetical protein
MPSLAITDQQFDFSLQNRGGTLSWNCEASLHEAAGVLLERGRHPAGCGFSIGCDASIK